MPALCPAAACLPRPAPHGAGLLAWFSVRIESVLAGPGEDDIELGIFGKDETGPMPAAQAPTEKIPTRRPEQPPAQR